MQKVPLNVKIFNDIYRKIESKQYKIGDILPTEKEMESIYGTSRAPVRQALSRLEAEGLIIRKPGKGTFIASEEVTGPWITMVGFGQEFGLKLDKVRCQTLSVKRIRANKQLAQGLALAQGTLVVHTARVRFLSEVPIYYLLHYTPFIDPKIIKEAGDFPSMRGLVKRAGIEVAYVSEELDAIKASGSVAEALQLEEGYPVLHLMRISYDENRVPVELTDYYVRTDDWKYRITYGNSSADFSLR